MPTTPASDSLETLGLPMTTNPTFQRLTLIKSQEYPITVHDFVHVSVSPYGRPVGVVVCQVVQLLVRGGYKFHALYTPLPVEKPFHTL